MGKVGSEKIHMKNWTVTASCGGRFPAIDPVFFSDRSRVAVASALAIKIFQLSTRQLIAKLAVDCTDVVQLLLTDSEQEFLVVRRSGHVDKIALDDSSSTKLDTDVKVKHLINEQTAIISNAKGMLELYSLSSSTTLFESAIANSDSGLYAVSSDYAAFMSPRSSKVELFNTVNSGVMHLTSANRSTVSCLAVSARGLVAIGNTSGVIDLLYTRADKDPQLRTLKWHLDPVTALKFAQNDEYLLSGGGERVLVFWQLATNRQQFLPRLDGCITSIATNGSMYGLLLDRSQLVVLSAVDLVSRLQVAGTRAAFEKQVPDHQSARRRRRKKNLDLWCGTDYTACLRVQPGTRHAYLLSDGAAAQVYNLARDEQDCMVKLARTLDSGRVRVERELIDPQVAFLEFGGDGKSMVTCDVAKTPRGLLSSQDISVQLKFWHLEEKWVVSTRVDNPHGAGVVVCDAVFGVNNAVVTAGSDGSLRQWRKTEGKWALKHIGAGFGVRSSDVRLAWSGDGSVLALAHENSLYLVDARTLRPIKQLPNIIGTAVRGFTFAQSNLVVLDRSCLVVFDLVTFTQRWAIEVRSPQHGSRLLAADPHSSRFALAVNYWTPQYRVNARVLQFGAASPVPLNSYTHPYCVAAFSLIPGTASYCLLDQRGVLATLADVQPDSEALGVPMVSASELVAQYLPAEPESDDEGASKSLDVNSVGKLFDSNANLEQLFDRVLTLVS